MVRLEIVNEDTFMPVIRMELPPEQSRYVASNAISLAQAWLHYDEARPYAICDGDTVVGFMMLDWDKQERTVGIWRLMIAPEHQKKGYGRKALELAIDMIRQTEEFDLIYLDYEESNIVARALYYSLGFRENGEMKDGEIIMTLPLTDHPQVGMLTADEEDLDQLFRYLEKDAETDPDAFAAFPERDILEEAIKKETVIRFAVMGETIGLTVNDNFHFRKKFLPFVDEARHKFKGE